MIKRIAIALSLAVLAMASPVRAQRFMFTGVTDGEVLAFFGKLQSAVNAGNKSAVAAMVNYPLRVNTRKGPKLVVANSADLVRQYDAVFTPAIRQAIAAEKPARLVGSHDGAGIGAGLVWFTGVCEKKARPPKCKLGVVSINHE